MGGGGEDERAFLAFLAFFAFLPFLAFRVLLPFIEIHCLCASSRNMDVAWRASRPTLRRARTSRWCRRCSRPRNCMAQLVFTCLFNSKKKCKGERVGAGGGRTQERQQRPPQHEPPV
jgi:hypothetical protein